MRKLLLLLGILGAFLCCGVAAACYNDRDTLGYELHNKPDVQRALTGRFDRFPPLYYQMRVTRLQAKGPLSPREYDDLAVALGRLGRNDEALAALALKAQSPGLTADDRYRLYANRGTIEAHKWMHDGGKVADMAEFKAAERDIAEALRLNPKAHFGREGTQLEFIRWLMDVKTPGKADADKVTLAEWLHTKMGSVDVATTLAGLIMLGGAWESPDAALAIGGIARYKHDMGIMSLALQRYRELLAQGRAPLDQALAEREEALVSDYVGSWTDTGPASTPARFKALRQEADAWHERKTWYVMEGLTDGRHPDTDPNFWAAWTEPPMPNLPTSRPWLEGPIPVFSGFVLLGVVLLIGRDRIRGQRQVAGRI